MSEKQETTNTTVWFNKDDVQKFKDLDRPEPFSTFIKNAFYEKIVKLKKEK